MNKKIYFAAPLFNEAEQKFNNEITENIEELGFSVFLPQRDGISEFDIQKPPFNKMSKEKLNKTIFDLDRKEIEEADVFLFVLDGRVPDEGACVELGIAYEHKLLANSNKKIIGLHTDTRVVHAGAKYNPMIDSPFEFIATSRQKLLDYLQNEVN